MAAPKRSKTQIQEHRTLIARLYLQGKTQAEIGVHLGLSQPQVSYDLRAIQDEWRQTRFRDLDQIKGRELARIDAVEREAWEGWHESRKPREQTRTKKTTGEKSSGEAQIIKTGQAGNPAFLSTIQWCIEQRLKIFGFYAPTKYSSADLDELIEQELKRLAKKREEDEPESDLVC